MWVIQEPYQNYGDQKIEGKPGNELKEISGIKDFKSEKPDRFNPLVCHLNKS
jgi:hypothetical protein